MDMNGYYFFVHVVEKKGFAPAGRALNIPKSRLSRHIAQLEDRLGVRLIQRTSRQFKVTDMGEAFYQHARKAVDEMEAANAAVEQHANALTGKIRLSCSVGMAQFALCQLVTDFLKLHPKVEIIQQVTNLPVNLIDAGVDMAIRAHTAPLPDSTLIQRRLATVSWGLLASPSYLEQAGIPMSPEELEAHIGLKLGWQPDIGHWDLQAPDGATFSNTYQPRLCSEDMVTLKHAASVGLGIVGLPLYTCREELRVKRLVRVLPDWTAGQADISLLMPSRQGVPPAVSSFANFLRDELPKIVVTQA
ncbi:LysR substrate-binding domain-containing protein [Gilvimarinus sp. SDUM040013]|uniref:LysR substrate-binding domain-containing protein n=1 Tax=Gilvimarinus gilvus TaxID=3058038 RepID=A0ABU4RTI5_9GAMM|nr:LysR substrate-binding domain-containing protein [Gilvimarinus sp. SDUM040013]MDO3386870.1 LysR substrate-binding domain-containing protein [Gilvimarinus sp. SDUM040013]MDX6848200.1 LysR substrate-binding domain-containing protein [Gilvimarinus sp. SDUM040013]